MEATESLALKALCVRAFVSARELGDELLADRLLDEWTRLVRVEKFDVEEARERLEPLVEQVRKKGGWV